MAHRKIDIDALDADQFMDDEELAVQAPTTAPTTDDGEGGSSGTMRATVTNIVLEGPRPAADVERAATARAAAVRSELSRGNIAGAVKKALEDPPIGRESPAAKTQNLQTVMDALQTAKANDVAATVKSLSVDEIDVLMKYLYRGMAAPEKFNAGALLQWHEKAVEAGGLGTIVRVLTDRKTV